MPGSRLARSPASTSAAATGIVGFSEGGHAALWAAQLAPEWTPTQPIIGAVIAAPASEVGQLASEGVGSNEFEAVTLGIVAGLAAAYPDAQAALGSVTTGSGPGADRGVERVGVLLRVGADLAGTLPLGRPDDRRAVRLADRRQSRRHRGVTDPDVGRSTRTEDERIPFAHHQVLIDRLCAAGQTVQSMPIERRPRERVASRRRPPAWTGSSD